MLCVCRPTYSVLLHNPAVGDFLVGIGQGGPILGQSWVNKVIFFMKKRCFGLKLMNFCSHINRDVMIIV